jgi:hypothetical protein
VAKGKLVTTDSRKEILGAWNRILGVFVEGLENIERCNKGDEVIPRPFDKIRTLIDAIGYVIPWPTTHVSLIFFSFEIVHVSVTSSNLVIYLILHVPF